ncbi:hypothetical protein AV521_32505 [Streptomyces sp. IMTB 2501]|uniref:hypothetical protein n=1 Tax=Streptomyces sp. IMTB 2501 TaxID=1776340 RepID=UPI00096DDBAE|nr:hypothetical protein [Streptomyces sp. IMTB 2501]OLZ65397.1 hypothetical protein AV521_32505 [Streptomyces sp. IMTB 2501]
MDIAALVAWVVTAVGGFVLLARWISRGGLRQQQTKTTHFPAPLVFGHFLLAAAGLVVWIVYLAADRAAVAWAAFGILVAVALLGFTMFARWVAVQRTAVPATAGEETTPAERHLPVPVVAAHGLLGTATLVLVLLAALRVGGS